MPERNERGMSLIEVLVSLAVLITVVVRAYFHANYLKPPQIDVVQDDVTPLAA